MNIKTLAQTLRSLSQQSGNSARRDEGGGGGGLGIYYFNLTFLYPLNILKNNPNTLRDNKKKSQISLKTVRLQYTHSLYKKLAIKSTVHYVETKNITYP